MYIRVELSSLTTTKRSSTGSTRTFESHMHMLHEVTVSKIYACMFHVATLRCENVSKIEQNVVQCDLNLNMTCKRLRGRSQFPYLAVHMLSPLSTCQTYMSIALLTRVWVWSHLSVSTWTVKLFQFLLCTQQLFWKKKKPNNQNVTEL